MVFNATFNISVISWRSVLSADDTGRPGNNHQPVASCGGTVFVCFLFCFVFTLVPGLSPYWENMFVIVYSLFVSILCCFLYYFICQTSRVYNTPVNLFIMFSLFWFFFISISTAL